MRPGTLILVLLAAGAVAIFFFGDVGAILRQLSAWGCEWFSPGKAC